jgi:putative membrane protein
MWRAAFLAVMAIAPAALAAPAIAGQVVADPARTPDATFVAKAMDAAALDAELAAVAVRRASARAVKALAQRVLESRQTIRRDLQRMAGSRRIAGAASPDHAKQAPALRAQPPAAFDAAFLAALASNTEAALALYESESRDGRDDEIKDWAARQLPAIREQLTAIRALRPRPGS